MTFLILILLFIIGALLYGIFGAVREHGSKIVEEPVQPDPKPEPKAYTNAEREAMRQAEEAFDDDTLRAVMNRTYNGPLPDYDGVYWSSIYPDLYHTKIAGVNYTKGIRHLSNKYFNALLAAEPKNKYDPNAIAIIHEDGYKRVGYIPADETEAVRSFVNNQLPYPCKARIREEYDYDGRAFLVGEININRSNVSPQ